MQDMKIEYRDGKLVELSIDGVSFLSASAISFSHTANEEPPTIILTMSVGAGERLAPASPTVKTCGSSRNDSISHYQPERVGGRGKSLAAIVKRPRPQFSFQKRPEKKEKSDGTARQKISCRDDGCVASGSG